jgi:CHAT domain-containing protein
VPQIQKDLLDGETALLEYSLGEERSFVWLVTATSLDSFELPGRAQIETNARVVAKLLSSGERWVTDPQINSQFQQEATKLSRTLLPAELVSRLRAKRLLVVSDGALHYLPFGVLPVSKPSGFGPLIANYEIVGLPSASTLAVLRQENPSRPSLSKSVAVIADPVFEDTDERIRNRKSFTAAVGETQSPNFEGLRNSQFILQRAGVSNSGMKTNGEVRESFSIKRLPFSRLEAEGILAAASPRLTLKATDFIANRETATNGELANYRYVHFATHGILNSEHPELSGIVLSLVNEQGQPVDGFLRLHDIYNLNLPADLVVLSACQTGLGREIRGEGLVGLTRGFMYAGAPRVVASLWKVDDAATAELMKRFYAAMLKNNLRPAAALRRAKVEMWKQKRWQAPFYWAAFELQGEWN